MSLIHIKYESGKWVSYGYGTSYSGASPVAAYIGLKIFRCYRDGLICSKYPLQRTAWMGIKLHDLSKKYSQLTKIMNARFTTGRTFI